jgi:hypothetical protein
MYDLLTNEELTVLQSMLFSGAEDAYWVADLESADPETAEQHCLAHHEIAALFIEAGTELVRRLVLPLALA